MSQSQVRSAVVMLRQMSCRGRLILVTKSLSPRLNLLKSGTQTELNRCSASDPETSTVPLQMFLTLWSVVAHPPAGQRDVTTSGITADTQQEVEQEVVRVSVVHLRNR